MQPNVQANGPNGPQDQSGPDDNEPTFSDLPPPVQQEVLAYVLQGKPRNPGTVQQAKTMLESDPETVEQICIKLGIFDKDGNPSGQSNNQEDDDDADDK